MKKIILLTLCALTLQYAYSQAVTPDLSFAGKGFTYTDFKKDNVLNQYGIQVLVQKDGNYLLVININEFIVLARYLSNGSLDHSFGSEGFTEPLYRGYAQNMNSNIAVLQSDGKIVLAGNTQSGLPQLGVVAAALPPSDPDFAIFRYNTDGSLDKTFGTEGKLIIDFGGADQASSLAIQGDGKIIVTGNTYEPYSGNSDLAIARFTADGLLDNSFDGDGKLITDLGGNDNGYNVNIQNDNKILITGYTYDLETYNPDFVLVRYNNDGSLDNSFDGDGKLVIDLGEGINFLPVAIQSDRKIVLAGSTYVDSGDNDIILARYNTDGSLDNSFDGDGKLIIDFGGSEIASSLAIRSDGRITLAGYAINNATQNIDFALARYNPDGSPDLSFGNQGKLTTDINGTPDGAFSLVLQNDDKIVAAGITLSADYSSADFVMVRYNMNGSLDNSFDGDGKMFDHYPTGISTIDAIAVQTDGKLVVAGSSGGRFRRALAEAVLPGLNRIAAAAPPSDLYSDVGLARYNPDGSPDPSFDGDGKLTTDFGGDDYATSIAIQSDGKIVVALSSFNLETDRTGFILARYNPDGSPDPGFGGDGKLIIDFPGETEFTISMTIQSDDKIVVAGNSYNPNTDKSDIALARFNTDGSPDLSFDGDGQLTTDYTDYDIATALAVQPDGKIVVAGVNAAPGYFVRRNITRYNTDGSLDNSFDMDGKLITDLSGDDNTNILAIQADGKIIVTGFYYNSDYNYGDIVLGRYNSNGSVDSSFDGDGKQSTDFFNRFAYNLPQALRRISYSPSLGIQDNGKIILAGTVLRLTTRPDFGLIRFNVDGTLDSTFGNQGKIISDFGGYDLAYSLYVSRDRLYVAGYNQMITPRGLIAAYRLACTEKEVCGNRLDDNCDGQVDETCPSMPYLTINNVTVAENLGRATLMVTLSKKSTEPVMVNYFTLDRTATSKPNKKGVKDYYAASGTLTIPAGTQYAVISIGIINDSIPEGEEYFDVHFNHPVHAALSGDKGRVTITDGAGLAEVSAIRDELAIKEPDQPSKLSVKVQPNPGQYYFNLVIQSSKNSPVTVKLVDATGRLIETKAGVAPNSTLQIGHNYRPGIYFAEIEQSGERVKIKLVKQTY